MQTDPEANKRLVMEFYQTVVVGADFSNVERYLSPDYIQHSPLAANGVDGLREFVAEFSATYPDTRLEFKRVIAEGDLVATHSHVVRFAGDRGHSVMDWFRVQDGRVAEHWESVTEIPEKTRSRLPLV